MGALQGEEQQAVDAREDPCKGEPVSEGLSPTEGLIKGKT
jgi:hypothetical protein